MAFHYSNLQNKPTENEREASQLYKPPYISQRGSIDENKIISFYINKINFHNKQGILILSEINKFKKIKIKGVPTVL